MLSQLSLKAWNEVPDVDRLGMEEQYVTILGVEVPHIIIPVRPGRDLARLIEVAAFQTKLKSSGHNPAKELNDRLIAQMAKTKKIANCELKDVMPSIRNSHFALRNLLFLIPPSAVRRPLKEQDRPA